MKTKIWLAVMLVFVMGMAAAQLVCVAAAQQDDAAVIAIYHTNDVHGAAGDPIGYAKLSALRASDDADAVLLVDAGDFLHGMPFATASRGENIAQLMQACEYDVVVPGNHDFDYGMDRLEQLAQTYQLNLLSANVRKDGETVFSPYTVVDAGSVQIGFFGITTPETSYKTNPENIQGVDFGTVDSVMQDAEAAVAALKGEGADIIIAVTHLGSEAWAEPSSIDLAQSVDGIDVIIDGHSHSVLAGQEINDTLITSSGEYMNDVGKVTITVQQDGSFVVDSELIGSESVADLAPDDRVQAIYEEIAGRLEMTLGQVVTTSPIALDGQRTSVRYGSTNLGRVITAAMMEETGADLAVINSGAIRASIPEGPVTMGDMISVLPYGNYIVTVEVTGETLTGVLDAALVEGAGGFPQFYGMTVTAERVVQPLEDGSEYARYKVKSVTVGEEPLAPDEQYTIAINDYMYSGGDEYQPFSDHLVAEYGTVSDAFIRYMERGDIVQAVQADVLVLTPLENSESPDAGDDAVALFLVLIAVSAAGLTVVKKRPRTR